MWTVIAEGQGYFVLDRRQETNFTFRVHPALRQIRLTPDLDERGRETGRFHLELDFVLENLEADPEAANVGRDVLAAVLDILTFSTGYPCGVTKDPHVRRPLSEKGAYREHFFAQALPLGPFGAGTVGPPPVLNEALLGSAITDEQGLILGWYRAALETSDYIESCTALFAALEPLAQHFPCDETRTEVCRKCKNKRTLAASGAQKVKSFLINHGGLSAADANAVWSLRNDFAHGHIRRTVEQRQTVAGQRQLLLEAIARGLRTWLGIDHEGMPPRPDGPSFSDAVLTVDYTVPENEAEVDER